MPTTSTASTTSTAWTAWTVPEPLRNTRRPAASPLRLVRRLAAGTVLLLVAAGCASMAPPYERPAAPVAAEFEGAERGSGPTAEDLEWQRFFSDERLKRLIGIALENNRDLRIAALAIEQARAQYEIRRADELPTINVGASGSRQPGTNGAITSLYTAGLSITAFEFDFFGRIRSLNQAALAQYLATEEARRTAQMSLVAAIAITYLNLLADDELLEVTRQTLLSREESLKLTRLKYDNGASSELDFRQAESLVQGARVTLAALRRQRALDQNALVLLIGQPLPADLPPPARVMDQDLVPYLPAGVPSETLIRRPDVRQAEQQLIGANANIGAARAAFFPRITLTGSAGVASNELSALVSGGRFAWTLLPQLLLPIFDSGRNQANLESARIGREIAIAQYERAIQAAFRDVADALASRETLVDQVRAQRLQVNAEAARLRLADLRYRNGVASYLDVLDAQRSLFSAQQAVIQAQTAQVQNLVTLYKVLGGGWQ